MRAEILKYDVNAPREQGFSNQRMYPDTALTSRTAEQQEIYDAVDVWTNPLRDARRNLLRSTI